MLLGCFPDSTQVTDLFGGQKYYCIITNQECTYVLYKRREHELTIDYTQSIHLHVYV